MRIRITKRGRKGCAVILMRTDWPDGAIITVSKHEGDAAIRDGWAELVTDAPEPPEEEIAEEEAGEEEREEPEPETATAEPFGETAMQKPPKKRRGGKRW